MPVTIREVYSHRKAIKGIQMESIASPLSGDQEVQIRRRFGAKFPPVAESADAPGAIVKAMAKVSCCGIAPDRVQFSDGSIAFGHRDKVDKG